MVVGVAISRKSALCSENNCWPGYLHGQCNTWPGYPQDLSSNYWPGYPQTQYNYWPGYPQAQYNYWPGYPQDQYNYWPGYPQEQYNYWPGYPREQCSNTWPGYINLGCVPEYAWGSFIHYNQDYFTHNTTGVHRAALSAF